MKKRTRKDFFALYTPEDEDKLVLIQSGVSADKTFLDTFWTAHTYGLAMADTETGQVTSGRCLLSWPITDKEREVGDYSKLFVHNPEIFVREIQTLRTLVRHFHTGAILKSHTAVHIFSYENPEITYTEQEKY